MFGIIMNILGLAFNLWLIYRFVLWIKSFFTNNNQQQKNINQRNYKQNTKQSRKSKIKNPQYFQQNNNNNKKQSIPVQNNKTKKNNQTKENKNNNKVNNIECRKKAKKYSKQKEDIIFLGKIIHKLNSKDKLGKLNGNSKEFRSNHLIDLKTKATGKTNREIYLNNNLRKDNLLVTGSKRAGKKATLSNLSIQDNQNKNGVLYFDFGDKNKTIARLKENLDKEVYYINENDENSNTFKLNLGNQKAKNLIKDLDINFEDRENKELTIKFLKEMIEIFEDKEVDYNIKKVSKHFNSLEKLKELNKGYSKENLNKLIERYEYYSFKIEKFINKIKKMAKLELEVILDNREVQVDFTRLNKNKNLVYITIDKENKTLAKLLINNIIRTFYNKKIKNFYNLSINNFDKIIDKDIYKLLKKENLSLNLTTEKLSNIKKDLLEYINTIILLKTDDKEEAKENSKLITKYKSKYFDKKIKNYAIKAVNFLKSLDFRQGILITKDKKLTADIIEVDYYKNLNSKFLKKYNLEEQEEILNSISELPKPKEINNYLEEYVIGQSKAKETLSLAVYNHYKRLITNDFEDNKLDKSNVAMIGPTGSGKTLLLKTLANKLEVPFTVVDATNYTKTGYQGADVEEIITKLVRKAEGDIEEAKKGIIYIDEIDKLATNKDSQMNSANESVQQALLKLLEGTEVEIETNNNKKEDIDTSQILFVVGGAFVGIEEIIETRLKKEGKLNQEFEVKEKEEKEKILQKVNPTDLIKFGVIPEMMGRIPVLVNLNELKVNDLVKILTEPKNSIINQYKKMFALDGVELKFSKESLNQIAKEAKANNTGARGLKTIIEESISEVMFDIPSENIEKCKITKNVITGNGKAKLYDETGLIEEKKKDLSQIQLKPLILNKQKQEKYKIKEQLKELPKPKELKDYLDSYVIGQSKAKKTLSIAVYNHYKKAIANNQNRNIKFDKSNVAMIGPTGSGKTLTVSTLADKLEVPFTVVDASNYTKSGYKGKDVAEIIKKLYKESKGNIERTKKGIVYIDEIDKLAVNKTGSMNSANEAVQQELLKLLEGNEVEITLNEDKNITETIDTTDILFITSGAFVGIEDIIKNRLKKENKLEKTDTILNEINSQDIVEFGIIPELVGRIPVVTNLNELEINDLVKILTETKNSIIKQYQEMFRIDDVELEFTKDSLRAIAKQAKENGTGARGLKNIVEDNVRDIMFNIPSQDIKKCIISKEVILKNKKPKLI